MAVIRSAAASPTGWQIAQKRSMSNIYSPVAWVIGSHATVVLAEAGHAFVLYDNDCNTKGPVLGYFEMIIGIRLLFIVGDVHDTAKLGESHKDYNIDEVNQSNRQLSATTRTSLSPFAGLSHVYCRCPNHLTRLLHTI